MHPEPDPPRADLEVAILIGLQAAGKSTFYDQHLAATHLRISKDLMPNKTRREARQQRQIHDALRAGSTIAVDNTNVSVAERGAIIQAARSAGARVVGYTFPLDFEVQRARNAARFAHDRVPTVGLLDTLRRYEAPSLAEGFDVLREVTFDGSWRVRGRGGRGSMKLSDLDREQRAREWFHRLTVPEGSWIVIRVDGRSFTGLTLKHFEKPFDARFSELMVGVAQALLVEFEARFAYTESDEVSVLLPPSFRAFDREVEKLVSISAGVASAAFTQAAGVAGHFDSRIWLGSTLTDVRDYFSWRQADAARCALNGWAYWARRKAGDTAKQATAALHGASESQKHELLFAAGVNFATVPVWQRRGVGLWWASELRDGVDPRHGGTVTARRRRIQIERELPMRDDYRALVERAAAGEA